jgi:hypothetical protein
MCAFLMYTLVYLRPSYSTTGLRMPDANTVKATTESLAHSIQLLPTLGGTDTYHESGINFAAGSDLLQR